MPRLSYVKRLDDFFSEHVNDLHADRGSALRCGKLIAARDEIGLALRNVA